jgi:hypothetical protein
MKTTTGCSADYTAGYDAGYKAGFTASNKRAREQDAEAMAIKKAHAEFLLNGPVPAYAYQGKLVMCASCGSPIGDSPVQKQEYNHIFLYCSTNCRDYHAVGA